jgi:hypothetical protein
VCTWENIIKNTSLRNVVGGVDWIHLAGDKGELCLYGESGYIWLGTRESCVCMVGVDTSGWGQERVVSVWWEWIHLARDKRELCL